MPKEFDLKNFDLKNYIDVQINASEHVICNDEFFSQPLTSCYATQYQTCSGESRNFDSTIYVKIEIKIETIISKSKT